MTDDQALLHLEIHLRDVERRECERSLYAFVKRAWLEIEPGTKFVENWHLKTVCAYLEAFHRGELPDKRLIINIPPGMMKSILLVCYNAWAWIDQPHLRFLSIANADSLATRDSLRVKTIVTSDWYQKFWPLELVKDQNEKTLFVNKQRGHRESQGITACVTGKRGDCFPAYMQIETEQGSKPIVDIKKGDLVWSYNHSTNERELKSVLHTIHKQNCEIVELVCSNGEVIHCTPDHKFWTIEEGYVAASELECSSSTSSFDLSNIISRDVKHFRKFFSREGGVFYKKSVFFRNFRFSKEAMSSSKHGYYGRVTTKQIAKFFSCFAEVKDYVSIFFTYFNFTTLRNTSFSSPGINCLWSNPILKRKAGSAISKITHIGNFSFSEFVFILPRMLTTFFFGPFTPKITNLDLAHSTFSNRIALSNYVTGTSVQANSLSNIRSEFSPRSINTYRKSSVSLSISDVLRTSAPSKVWNIVVDWVTIKMSNFMLRTRSGSVPSKTDADMHKESDTSTIVMSTRQQIAAALKLFKYLLFTFKECFTAPYFSRLTSNESSVTNRVHTLVSGDGTPLNVVFNRKIGHIADTYCLTIKDNHNMYVGKKTTLSHNCLLLDDLIDSQHAFSDVKRQYVNDTWDQALTSRLNDMVHSGVILIMQRLHEKDITGHLLSKVKSKWTHLSIPMRYEGQPTFDAGKDIGRPDLNDPRKKKGELLFPKRFPLKSVEQLEEDLGEYGTAGQLMQRPQPSGGGILKSNWWRIWPDDLPPPKIQHQFASFDTAFSDKSMKAAAFSAMTRWGIFWHEQRQRYCILALGVWWDRAGYEELRRIAKEVDKKHDLDVLLVERKSTGISLIQDLKVAVPGKVVAYTPGAGEDKVSRAHSVSPMLQSGLVYVPNKLWALGDGVPGSQKPGLVGWVAQFPTGGPPSADLTDTVTQALIYMRKNQWIGDMDEDIDYSSEIEHAPTEEEMEDYGDERIRFYG